MAKSMLSGANLNLGVKIYHKGSKQKIIYQPLPKDDPKQRKPDITKAQEILGWAPKVDRKEGLKITFEYFKQALNK